MSMLENSVQKQFFDSLRLGTGKAYLLLKDHPEIDFSPWIIKGAVTNFAYDPQCEGAREDYIYRLICHSGRRDHIISTILRRLKAKKRNDWNLHQMYCLAARFFRDGRQQAKQIVLDHFVKSVRERACFDNQSEVMAVGGIDGVLIVAECVGKYLSENAEAWEDSFTIDDFQERNPAIDVYGELARVSQSNPYVAAYYKSITDHHSTPWPRKRRKRLTYDAMRKKIYSDGFGLIGPGQVASLTEEEVEKLAADFLDEKSDIYRAKYLNIFCKRKFPFEYEPLFRLACRRRRSQNREWERVRERALESLKFFTAPELRDFALEKIQAEKNPCDFLHLLAGNYRPGDYRLLNEVIDRSDAYDYIHSMIWGFIDIYRANPVVECREPLEKIYHKMNCGLHRRDIVQLLYDANVLSREILQELPYDSCQDNMPLYRKIIRGCRNR